MTTGGLAYLVDDDAAIRDALAWLLRSRGVQSRAWPSAEAFLADYREDMNTPPTSPGGDLPPTGGQKLLGRPGEYLSTPPKSPDGDLPPTGGQKLLGRPGEFLGGCLVLDVRMTGMTGTELFERLLTLGCALPVIFLTGHGDVPLAVKALKRGAFDFIEKPFNDNELADRVIEALKHDQNRRWQDSMKAQVSERLATLTEREREVMSGILAGKLNKVIADELQIAMRTVEAHRANIFDKMGVRSAVELAQRLAVLGPGASR